jgi:hypothetical protein
MPLHKHPLPTADYNPTTDYHSPPQTTTPHHKQPLPFADNHSLPQTATPFCRQPLPLQIKQILNELIEESIRFRHIRHEGQLQICINLRHNLPTIIKKRKVPNKNKIWRQCPVCLHLKFGSFTKRNSCIVVIKYKILTLRTHDTRSSSTRHDI